MSRERVAIIRAHPRTGLTPRLETIRRYMPGNYEAAEVELANGIPGVDAMRMIVIVGQDNAGWTLDEYVIPRLASGLYFAEEQQGKLAAALAAHAVVALTGEADELAQERSA